MCLILFAVTLSPSILLSLACLLIGVPLVVQPILDDVAK